MRRLTTTAIGQLVHIVTGKVAPPAVVEDLHRRTDGDPREVLLRVLVTLWEGILPRGTSGSNGSQPAGVQSGTFRHDGDYWTLTYEGRTVRLRDARGFHYLVPLLRSPGRPVHVQEIVRAGGAGRRIVDAERARVAVTKGIKLVLDRLRERHRPLADHLAATIRRGSHCRYVPDPEHPIAWEV